MESKEGSMRAANGAGTITRQLQVEEKNNCPECRTEYNTTNFREVKDTCGCTKCWCCIKESESGCRKCKTRVNRSSNFHNGPTKNVTQSNEGLRQDPLNQFESIPTNSERLKTTAPFSHQSTSDANRMLKHSTCIPQSTRKETELGGHLPLSSPIFSYGPSNVPTQPVPHEGSEMDMKLPSDWTELPAELLMMIFDNLKMSSKKQRKLLLNCRLIHPRWKSAIDDLLEKRSLSFWKTWKQPICNPYKFPVVQFNPNAKNDIENVLFPLFLKGDLESCPFPTKSVCLTSEKTCKDSWLLSPKGDAHFFSKYGHHLTSLTIELNHRKDLTAQTLQKLLSHTPHLKAISLINTNHKIKLLEKDVGKICLPPLPHLEHVRLDYRMQNWILEPYTEQLISVRCTEQLGCENSSANLPMLKQLVLWYPTTRQLLAPAEFPSLKCLDLIMIKLGRQVYLEHIFKFLSRVASTLVDLHLDIIKNRRSKSNPINYENDQTLQELQEIHQSRFTNLKTLTIVYPKFEEEVKVVKDFLKMFPNLETLNFTRFGERPTWCRNPKVRELRRKTVREHLNREKYQGLCPKLRTINVYKFIVVGDGKGRFVTSKFPFPS